MVLETLSLVNFRNHRQLTIELPNLCKPLYISGDNGIGKTSIVEAIYLLYTMRTFRQQSLNDIKTIGAEYMRIEGKFNSDVIQTSVLFYQQERKLIINGQHDYISLSEYTHITPVICYSPSFETLLADEHSERRRFLDRIIFYLDKNHLLQVKKYNLLMQRKRAELEKNKPDGKILQIFNEQIIELSENISKARLKLVENLNESINSLRDLADVIMPDIDLTLSINNPADKSLENEIEKHKPLYGCHKDLLYIRKNNKIIEKFQSFGQKKSCLLFLLYNLACYLKEKRNCDIFMLFDDFEAGLDAKRCEIFAELIRNYRGQVVLTGITNNHFATAESISIGL